MDQIKIGGLIATCRKEKKLTQMQLAERLNVTDKAVSKWERGNAIPDPSIMLALCEILGISVNELLMGERLEAEATQKNEQLLLDMAREMAQKDKTIWTSMWVLMTVGIISLLVGIIAVALWMPAGPWQLVAIIAIVLWFLPFCFYALKLELSVGAYKCKNCGQEILPTYAQVLWAMHKGTTRYLKCPHCQQRTWCKKVIKK